MSLLDRLTRGLTGRYEVEKEIGRGGTSIVYLARDLKHQRHVALKVLDPELTTGVGAERFLLEIRATAQLNHPHILPLHDSGESDGVLYYVIPYVEGQSLRHRLDVEHRLSVEESLRIGAEVSDALAYAHGHGFIHRDIKPGNILLGYAGHAYVADFGLARVLFGSEPGHLTTGRLAVGTPWYMSPEQALGDAEIGTATDVYSLTCVLFEMLSGRPPFIQKRAVAVIAAHTKAPPPSLGEQGFEVPGQLEGTVRAGLAKRPEDRPSAGELAELLRTIGSGRTAIAWGPVWRRPSSRQIRGILVSTVVLVTILIAFLGPWSPPVATDGTSMYAVFPIEGAAGLDGSDLATALASNLRDWEGIDAHDLRIVRSELVAHGVDFLDLGTARTIAIALEADAAVLARVIEGQGGRIISATVYDVTTEAGPIRARARATQPLPDNAAQSEDTLRRLAFELLFPGLVGIDGPIDHAHTRVVQAVHDYAAGHQALRDWNLEAADSAFADAGARDPDFGEAHLWLAQIRGWASDDGLDRLLVANAVSHLDSSDERHFQLAQALLRMAEREFPEACEIYESLVESHEEDFVARYGLGECLRLDDRIVADDSMPWGYAFRASRHRAVLAYEEVFSSRPEMMTMFNASGYDRLRSTLLYGVPTVRDGRTEDGEIYLAYPALLNDTLAFDPVPLSEMEAGSPDLIPTTRVEAARAAQQRFRDLATLWVGRQPSSAVAHEALAIAQEIMGDPEAPETLAHALELAGDAPVGARIRSEQVRLMVRSSLPDDTVELRRARALADSIIRATDRWRDADRHDLAGLVALTGNAELVGRLMAANPAHAVDRRRWGPGLIQEGYRLLAYAAIGADEDSLVVIERRLSRMIRDQVAPADQAFARRQLLAQAARMALPVHPFDALVDLDHRDARLGHLLHSGDTLASSDRDILANLPSPAQRNFDAIFVEAWLMTQSADMMRAARHLDTRLESLGSGAPANLRMPVQLSALLRSICLRLDIAARQGEAQVLRRWGPAYRILAPPEVEGAYSSSCGSL